jgi:hypoxanthine-DNA glycosylase
MAPGFSILSRPAPVADELSRILILGASAGVTSSRVGEHYAGRGNVFWRVVGEIFGFSPELPYSQRVALLQERGIALWNVCGVASRRASSSRAAIACPNDFGAFFEKHPAIDLILFNGVEAKSIYNHQVRHLLPNRSFGLRFEVMPSTSPLYSRMSYAEKRFRWSAALVDVGRADSAEAGVS